MAKANPEAAVWLIKGSTPTSASAGVLASAKMGAAPYPSIPQMGLLHGALSTEMVEFLQGTESAEKALQDVEAAYIAKATEQGFL
jgi:maltose-binding protein MalE